MQLKKWIITLKLLIKIQLFAIHADPPCPFCKHLCAYVGLFHVFLHVFWPLNLGTGSILVFKANTVIMLLSNPRTSSPPLPSSTTASPLPEEPPIGEMSAHSQTAATTDFFLLFPNQPDEEGNLCENRRFTGKHWESHCFILLLIHSFHRKDFTSLFFAVSLSLQQCTPTIW